MAELLKRLGWLTTLALCAALIGAGCGNQAGDIDDDGVNEPVEEVAPPAPGAPSTEPGDFSPAPGEGEMRAIPGDVTPAPVEPAPIEPAPTEPAPTEPGDIGAPAEVEPAPAEPGTEPPSTGTEAP